MFELDRVFKIYEDTINQLPPLLKIFTGQIVFFSLSLAAATFALLFLFSLRHYPNELALRTIKNFIWVPILIALAGVGENYLRYATTAANVSKELEADNMLQSLRQELVALHEQNMELEERIVQLQSEKQIQATTIEDLENELKNNNYNSNLKKLAHFLAIKPDRKIKAEVDRFSKIFTVRQIQTGPKQSAYFFNNSNSTLKMTLGYPPNSQYASYIEVENIYLDQIILPEELRDFNELTYFGYSIDVIKAVYGKPLYTSSLEQGLRGSQRLTNLQYHLPLKNASKLVADFVFQHNKLKKIKISWL